MGITASQVLSWQQSKSAVDKDIKEIREFSADTIQFSLISLNSLNSLSLDSHAKLRFAQNDGLTNSLTDMLPNSVTLRERMRL